MNTLRKSTSWWKTNMNTSLLICLISIGKTGFHAFVVTSLTILKLMVLVVMILARRVKFDGMDDSWFGGSR